MKTSKKLLKDQILYTSLFYLLNNMDYEVQKIFKWFNQFNKKDIKLKSESKEFYIEVRNLVLPHLLGLQYMNYKLEKIKGIYRYNEEIGIYENFL